MNLRDKESMLNISPLTTKGRNYHHLWLRDREMGKRSNISATNKINREMYSTIRPISQWESTMSSRVAMPGGIFNLEFSPDGSLMVAACEKRSILLFDPTSQKYIQSVDNAHGDCVNCVKFLDSRMFATCSDDSTVALWDTRNLKAKIRVLNGHSNWVKNVEYSREDNLLVTSGFDGTIYTWDINSYTERGLLYKRAFHTNGLMRMKLSPDASKMVICTTAGYIMVIHDLNLETLPADLLGFKPNMYRLMQISETTIPVAAKFTHLFSHRRKRNRLEFMADFPRGDEAEVISSLQIHPHGWCALSRNITTDEHSEWTCVHDIQDYPVVDGINDSPRECERSHKENVKSTMIANGSEQITSNQPRLSQSSGPSLHVHPSHSSHHYANRNTQSHGHSVESDGSDDVASISASDIWEALMSIHESRDRPNILLGLPPFANNMSNGVRIVRVSSGIEEQYLYEEEVNSSEGTVNTSSMSTDSSLSTDSSVAVFQDGPTAYPDALPLQGVEVESSSGSSSSGYRSTAPNTREAQTIIIVGPRNTNNSLQRTAKGKHVSQIPANHRIHQNRLRLTHYIEETNAGKGFIKELGFSQDGRVICSPFSYGVRLLAFNESCAELSNCVSNKTPVQLHEIGTSTAHNDIVLCTKFSPRYCMLVSGCHSGNIIWYQPVF